MPAPASQPTPPIASDPSLLDCLSRHGFAQDGSGRFSNGRAALRFEGTNLFAESAPPTRIWRSDLREVSPALVVALLDQLLTTLGFLSATEIERQTQRIHDAKIALDRIVELIREAPNAAPSVELLRFLWSLFNGHHLLNLWRLRHTLDRQQSAWATELFTAWMNGHVSEELLRHCIDEIPEVRLTMS